MFDKLGNKALAVPLMIALVLACILGLAISPILRANPNEVPFAIVNLDKGATTIAGTSNVGKTLTDKLVSGDASLSGSDESEEDDASGSSASSANITWTQLSSEEELNQALDDNRFYGGIVIPANFTSQQMSTQVGLGNAPKLTVYLNVGKNPQMASSMRISIMEATLQQSIAVDVKMVNDADLGGGSMASTMGVQMLVMPLFVMTMVGSILIALLFWRKDITGLRKRSNALALLVQLVIIAVFSAAITALAMCIDTIAGGMTLPLQDLFAFLWPADMLLMLLFVGLCDLSFPIGAVISVGVFALGMGTAMLAPEMLPSFWAAYVYPWAPQAAMGQSIRQILYFGRMPGSSLWMPLIVEGAIGAIALILAACIGAIQNRKKGSLRSAASRS